MAGSASGGDMAVLHLMRDGVVVDSGGSDVSPPSHVGM